MNNCFFIFEGAFTFKVEVTGVLTRGFFVSGDSEFIDTNNNNNFTTSTLLGNVGRLWWCNG